MSAPSDNGGSKPWKFLGIQVYMQEMFLQGRKRTILGRCYCGSGGLVAGDIGFSVQMRRENHNET
ncbi:uncharacterized protein LOC119770656 isoform X2 [Culex quinquefasciatus]|uniref:uncharacterized protein LOC119770656 isoform X2 n=1 Tax=Culex quinquefasciatus TaxID=7176 RepID=UPI0018E3A130|nr:uncharacterized protein LOC119770656 isoform X2 [Culex quinquefasciatus]